MPDIDQLIGQLAAAESTLRLQAVETLMRMEARSHPAAVALVRACGDANESVREAAVAALEGLGPPLQEDLGALAGLLTNDQSDVAYWAATLLGRLQANGAAATEALEQTLNSAASPAVRERAAWALGQIGPSARAAISSLQKSAADSNPRLARLAQKAIEQIGG